MTWRQFKWKIKLHVPKDLLEIGEALVWVMIFYLLGTLLLR